MTFWERIDIHDEDIFQHIMKHREGLCGLQQKSLERLPYYKSLLAEVRTTLDDKAKQNLLAYTSQQAMFKFAEQAYKQLENKCKELAEAIDKSFYDEVADELKGMLNEFDLLNYDIIVDDCFNNWPISRSIVGNWIVLSAKGSNWDYYDLYNAKENGNLDSHLDNILASAHTTPIPEQATISLE